MVSAYRVQFRLNSEAFYEGDFGRAVSDQAIGVMTVTEQVISLDVADGIDQLPQASVVLPLKRSTQYGRVPYSVLIKPGDRCVIEVLASHGLGEGWTTVLDGVVRSVNEREHLANGAREVGTTVEVGSYADILSEDAVAWWMFYGYLEGWARVRTRLTEDQMTKAPFRVAHDYMNEIGMQYSVYQNLGVSLSDRVHLAFSGLEANSTLAINLTMAEGTHMSIVQGLMDAPLHELYATTMPSALLPAGGLVTPASSPHRENDADGGATTLVMRASPYIYADPSGRAVASDWNALPLHTLEGVTPIVDQRGGTLSKAAIRNFTLVYPAYQFLDEDFAYANGAAIVNDASIRRFGYRPLKFRSHLILNDNAERQSIIEFMHALSWRVAGQWNQQHLLKNGVVSCPLTPTIRPGERVRFRDPWAGERLYEYHVRARHMRLSPVDGARMSLNVERGAPVERYQEPDWLVEGLQAVTVLAHDQSESFRGHDEPGFGGPFA